MTFALGVRGHSIEDGSSTASIACRTAGGADIFPP